MKTHYPVYEGKEPYIFISYSHRDADAVDQILGELDRRGFRFWYDEGITPGSEWAEDVARHLNDAGVVLAVISPRSMESDNCRREINFALSKNKALLTVTLERTRMSLGMEMQLSSHQSILRYNYTDWNGFVNRIVSSPVLQSSCGGNGKAPGQNLTAQMAAERERREQQLLDLFLKAQQHADKEDYQSELQFLLDALAIDPGSATVLVKLGRCYRRLGMHQKALEMYEQAERISPEDPTIYGNIGAVYLSRDEFGKARPYYEKAIGMVESGKSSEQINEGILYGNYALCLGRVGDRENAVRNLRTAREKGYGEEKIRDICGQLGIDPGLIFPNGTAAAQQAVPPAPSGDRQLNDLYLKADKSADRGDYQAEERFLLDALAIDPGNGVSMVRLGRCYRRQGQYLKALGMYDLARKSYPDDPTIEMNVGAVYLSQGEFRKARACYEKAIGIVESAGNSAQINEGILYGNYALCLGRLGDRENAVRNLRTAKNKGYSGESVRNICNMLGIDPAAV